MLLALIACGPLPSATLPLVDEAPPPLTPADLWSGEWAPFRTVTVQASVASGRLAGELSFYVQDPAGGPESGLRVDLGGALPEWPPPVGTPVQLRGTWWLARSGPRLFLSRSADGLVLGPPERLVATPWNPDEAALLLGTLVDLGALTVTSDPDPTGRAETDLGVDLLGGFGWTPGWGRSGSAVAIAVGPAEAALRTRHDWSGEWPSDPPLELTIAELRSAPPPDGTPVRVQGTLVTPWDRAGQTAVLQDEAGVGLWLDGEGWAFLRTTSPGQGVEVLGEVRTDGDGLRLRVWTELESLGTEAALVTQASPSDGALVVQRIEAADPPDALGQRALPDGDWLDPRFVTLDGITFPATIEAVIRETPAGLHYAVLSWEAG